MYQMQEMWNSLPQREVLTYDQYDLAERTDIPAEQWSKFLRDGQVQKFVEREIELFKQAQMRKLIAKSTENDKSVGTAQMLNAIGKTLDDTDAESNFFIYTHVPLTENECHADYVTQDLRWQPPEVIEDVDEEPLVLETPTVTEAPKSEEVKLDDDEWF